MLVLLLGTRIAMAETLVMVSPPPELDAAVRSSLAPWRVKIIVIDMAAGSPAELALTQGAGFVVWRDDDELVLWNASGGVGERRDIPPGLDDASAAALALSIKTWMNLGAPPPPDVAFVEDPPPPPPPPPIDDGPAVHAMTPAPRPLMRIDAATGVRANTGDHGRTDLRVALAAGVRLGPIDALLAVELGPSHPASAVNGTGELSTLVVGAHARWPIALSPALSIAPGVGVVLARNAYAGVDTMDRAFSSSALSPGFDVTGVVEWRWKRLVLGAEVGATGMPLEATQQDRNVRLDTPAHLETRGLARLGVVLR